MESKRSPSRCAELPFLPSQSLRIIKAMWALRTFILLPLAAAFRSTSDEAQTAGLGPVGQCVSKYEGTDWAKLNGQAVQQCRWRIGQKVPLGYCEHAKSIQGLRLTARM